MVRWTIERKGTTLIALPLVLQLVFYGVLLDMERRAEQEADRADAIKEVYQSFSDVNRELVYLYARFDTLLSTSPGHSFAEEGKEIEEIEREVGRIKRAMKTIGLKDENLERQLDAIADAGSIALKVLPVEAERGTRGLKEEFDKYSDRLNADVELLRKTSAATSIKRVMEVNREQARAQSRFRSDLRGMLATGIGLNIAFAIIAVRVFFASLVDRLKKISADTIKFSLGLPLNPPLSGDDELSQLDSSFAQMARAAREAEAMQQELLAMVSHDLKTPLTSVGAYFEFQEMGMFGEQTEKGKLHSTRARASVNRMFGIVLDFINLQKGRTEPLLAKMERLNLREIFMKVEHELMALAEVSRTKVQYQPIDCYVTADAEKTARVLINLVSNAMKHSPVDGIVVVNAEKLDDQHVKISVSDQGSGIPPEMREKLFNGLVNTEGTQYSTGVGLMASKMYVELQSGTIGVADTGLLGGATFYFTLAIAPEEAGRDTIDQTIDSSQADKAQPIY